MDKPKVYKGNSRSVHVTLGARNGARLEREANDYYATDPKALELLLEQETFAKDILEPACGGGHLSKVLEAHGYNVTSTDLIDRGYGEGGHDFFEYEGKFDGDIITNPPYKMAQSFVEKALDTVNDGSKVVMLLRIQFLEGKARRELFKKHPPKTVYVSSSRLRCALGGDFEQHSESSAVCFCWFIWEKGYKGTTAVKWFN